jgi:hypothetical protein
LKRRPIDATPRWLTILAWVSVAAAVVILFGLWPPEGSGGDLWLHLAVGRWIWQHAAVPLVDVFSYVTAGQEFIAHSWLAEVAFYRVEQAAGTVGLMLLRFGLISLALTAALQTARLFKAPWPALLLLAPLCLVVMWGRLEFRPQLFTTALLAFELYLIVSVHTGQRSSHWLWALPPMLVLWINLHAGWAQGLAMLAAITAAAAVMEARRRWLGSGVISAIPLRRHGFVLIACGLALLINPYGLRFLYFPLEMQAPWIRAMWAEWQSPFASGLVDSGLLVYSGHGSWTYKPILFGFMVVVAGVLYTRVTRWRETDLVPVAMLSLWLALGLWYLRAAADMTLLLSPFVAAALPLAWWRGKPWLVLVGSSLSLGVATMGLWMAFQLGDWQWNAWEPLCVKAAIERLGLSGRMMAGYEENHFLLHRFSPAVQVNFTWEYVAGEAHTAELRAALSEGPARRQAYLDRYHVDVVMLPRLAWTTGPALMRQGWDLVHMDDRYILLLRQGRFPRVPRYRWVQPWDDIPVTTENAHEIIMEAERALASCPGEAIYVEYDKASALLALGHEQEALAARQTFDKALMRR